MTEWDEAKSTRTAKISSLRKLISCYDYSSEETAHRTDEVFSGLVVENLRACKKLLFNVLDTAFSLHRDLLLKGFENLRDEVDVFSDEIKARAFKWDDTKTSRWLERLVDYDYSILSGIGRLYKGLESLHKEFLASGQDARDLRNIDDLTRKLKAELDELVALFKERDLVCNIEDASLDDTFDDMRTEIREGF